MRRGDVFRLRLRKGLGHELHGIRFGVVVQSDVLRRLSTVLVAPTSTSARAASFRPEMTVAGQSSRVLVEQTGAVDVTRLGDLAGHLPPEELWGVDLALTTVFDLHR